MMKWTNQKRQNASNPQSTRTSRTHSSCQKEHPFCLVIFLLFILVKFGCADKQNWQFQFSSFVEPKPNKTIKIYLLINGPLLVAASVSASNNNNVLILFPSFLCTAIKCFMPCLMPIFFIFHLSASVVFLLIKCCCWARLVFTHL